MKRVKDYKIGIRLNFFLGISIVIILNGLGYYIYQLQRTRIVEDADKQMTEQVNDLAHFVQIQVKDRQERVNASIDIASKIIEHHGSLSVKEDKKMSVEALNQTTQETRQIQIPSLYLGSDLLYNNTSISDEIGNTTHIKTTFFQKTELGYLRISTTILKLDGSRAVGTYITNTSPVAQAIE